MLASKRALVVALACLSTFSLSSFAPAQQSDQVIAERVLGPQWKQLSRRAGMIFAGTVLTATPLAAATRSVTTQIAAPDRAVPAAVPRATPAVQLSFRVGLPVACPQRGHTPPLLARPVAWPIH